MTQPDGCIANCSSGAHTLDTPRPLYCTQYHDRQFYGTSRPTWHTISQYYLEEQTGLRSGRMKLGDVVFDVGPHNGFFTMKAAECVGTTGTVVAVEASVINWHIVNKMMRCNRLSNVQLVFGAAYSEDGKELTLHSQSGADGANISTVGNTVAPDHFIGRRSNRTVRTFKTEGRTVTSMTVDALLQRLDLPRIDHLHCTINGVEMDVLQGAVRAIERHSPEVVVADRFHQHAATAGTPDLRSWLEQHGYHYFRDFDIRLGQHALYDNGTLHASQTRSFDPPDFL